MSPDGSCPLNRDSSSSLRNHDTPGHEEPHHHGEKELPTVAERTTQTDHSVFTQSQKRWIILITAIGGWFSTASSFIYFPAIPFLAHDLNVSIEKINFSVTAYLIASGVFPSITGSAADRYGRRPVFGATLAVYVAVNIGLALQRSFATLISLCMLQSAAISGSFAFAYGVLGDLSTPADRGGFVGFLSIFLNTPPSVAPMISGLLLINWNWSSIFWFLSIFSCAVLLAVLLLLPETCRAIAGNGSTRPPRIVNRVILPILRPPWSKLVTTTGLASPDPSEDKTRKPKATANPLAGLSLLKHHGILLSIVCYAIYYTVYSCLQASLSTIFVEKYHVTGLVAGLIYIPFGVSCVIASSLTGKLLDYDYRRTAKALGVTVNKRKGDDLAEFPIEYARLRTCKWITAVCGPLIVGYGWALQGRASMAVPLVLQFFIGFTNQVNFTSLNALLVDYHPNQSSTIQAVNNLFRCELAAGGLALLDVMLRKLGPGRTFVIFASLHMATLPGLWVLEQYGLGWRKAEREKKKNEKNRGEASGYGFGNSLGILPSLWTNNNPFVGCYTRRVTETDPKLLDPSIVGELPKGCQILTITKHGETNWLIGSKITVRLFIDPPKAQHDESFFVKIISRASYLPMAQAEYEGQLGLSRVIPQHAVKPIAWGSYRRFDHSQKLKTFTWFLTPFHTLHPATPKELSSILPLIIKAIQQNSVSSSGKFGFHIAPFFGPPRMQHVTNWTSSWEEFFTREFRSNLAYLLHFRARELKNSGLNDFVRLAEQFIVKVIPRLLRPLQTGGRSIKAVLLHGDLWHGNISIDTATGQMLIFDPCAFYGHQEMELQCWVHNPYHDVPGGSGLKAGR